MKNYKFLTVAALSVMLAGCSSNDEDTAQEKDNAIRVATNIDGMRTRAGMVTSNLTEFYLDIASQSSDETAKTTYSYFKKMTATTTDGSTTWATSDGSTMLWQDNKTHVSVTAAYLNGHEFTQDELRGTSTVSSAVTADQSTATAIEANDLLGMATTDVDPSALTTANTINVTLGHALAKLKVKVTLGTEFNVAGTETNPISSLTVSGTKLKYTYTGSTAAVASPSESNDAADITPYADADNYVAGSETSSNAVAWYECILVPQTIDANGFSVSLIICGTTYKWTSTAAITLQQGYQYELDLTAGDEIVTLNNIKASKWTEGTGADLKTE